MSFRFKKGGELKIGSLYQKNLISLASRIVHEGIFENIEPTQILCVAHSGAAQLSCLVNKENRIVGAKHSSASGTLRVLLDQFCAEITGLPIQEASEHGVLKLEYRLRDKSLPHEMPGILTPKNTDPVFQVALDLVREIFQKYRKSTNYEFTRNFYVDVVQPSFAQLSKDEKIQKIQTTLNKVCQELGLQEDVEVVDFKPDARAVLSYKQAKDKPNFGKYMLKVECSMQNLLEPRLELVLESVDDANKRKERSVRKACTTSTSEASV
jgi:hypothetical protein